MLFLTSQYGVISDLKPLYHLTSNLIKGWLWLRRWTGSSNDWKVDDLIPGPCSLLVKVSLGKVLNPKLLPLAVLSVCE